MQSFYFDKFYIRQYIEDQTTQLDSWMEAVKMEDWSVAQKEVGLQTIFVVYVIFFCNIVDYILKFIANFMLSFQCKVFWSTDLMVFTMWFATDIFLLLQDILFFLSSNSSLFHLMAYWWISLAASFFGLVSRYNDFTWN